MHKFTLFSIILSLIVIFIVVELVRNDYVTDYQNTQYAEFGTSLQSTETNPNDNQGESSDNVSSENEPSAFPELDTAEQSSPTEEDKTLENSLLPIVTSNEKPADDLLLLSNITESLLSEASFDNPLAEPVEFNNLIFQKIPVGSLGLGQIIKFNVFEKDSYALSIYESLFGNAELAGSFYTFLLDQSNNLNDMIVNQTNTFGKSSFYLNQQDNDNKRVFLVVLFDKAVYAFEYPSENHIKVKQLITIFGNTK